MLRQARIIRSIILSLVVSVFEYTTFFKYTHKKKSRLDKSGDLGHHDIGSPRPIHLPKNVRSKSGLTMWMPTKHARRRTCLLFAASFRLFFQAPRFTYPLHIALSRNDTWAAFGERALSAITSFYLYLLLDVKQG